jgi:hypothetical protein
VPGRQLPVGGSSSDGLAEPPNAGIASPSLAEIGRLYTVCDWLLVAYAGVLWRGKVTSLPAGFGVIFLLSTRISHLPGFRVLVGKPSSIWDGQSNYHDGRVVTFSG